MIKYALTVIGLIALEILAAMAVVQYVDVFYSKGAAYDIAHLVGPVTLLVMGLTMAMLDGWRCDLSTRALVAHKLRRAS